ncbi:hypothetical protein [Mesorhizobium sp. M1E.F.Ca.ET.041.01.1.1]|uniref:hypothetical protein n=1 Tax=Mesorhizobium sp. M1E.F.Ca.ET.041.01.1.1 TaxID=2496759 RepID=UPI0016766E94|nr:hypothetical protein [Mesorhizobium sp. M1E.F.Ca.ET.041.01.1.1]
MELAVCFDHSGIDLAWSIFLGTTAVLMVMAPLAVARLVAISRADSVGRLQIA